MKRLYFLLPNLDSARRVERDLLLDHVENRHLHFLARRGTDLGQLHEASFAQKSDVVRGAEIGLPLGALCGALIGVWMYLSPPDGIDINLVAVLLGAVGGGLFGTWIASLIGISMPNSRLKKYAAAIEAGAVLLMVDVPRSRVQEVLQIVNARHPEVVDHGIEPIMPAFP
ncbi:MAG: DUF1269 domain-containing protein [Rhodocyclaceae bacterium]|nr:DUF1269 domain-containing protein [Rhodocyclaceae bacterium]MBX3670626.1 DUF1269 domain-containing protein [Rhodocyclaceae bacterium]